MPAQSCKVCGCPEENYFDAGSLWISDVANRKQSPGYMSLLVLFLDLLVLVCAHRSLNFCFS